MRNKKASIFELGLVTVTFVALAFALSSFMFIQAKIEKGASPDYEFIGMYDSKERAVLVNEERLNLMAQQAFYDIAKEGAIKGNDCVVREVEYVEWNENCSPNNENIKKDFISKINGGNASLDNSILALKTGSVTKTIEEKGYINYNVSFTFNTSVEFKMNNSGINIDDFEEIYNKAIECKKYDVEKTNECIDDIENWDINVKKSDGYVLYDLSTKKNFFHDGKFEPIMLKFAIKSWFL